MRRAVIWTIVLAVWLVTWSVLIYLSAAFGQWILRR